ncbi:MAG: hypothetical protein FIA94_10075 [Nitrospirae bacterium]|nr:hypothetical protein [Nitrospirota bacterium]
MKKVILFSLCLVVLIGLATVSGSWAAEYANFTDYLRAEHSISQGDIAPASFGSAIGSFASGVAGAIGLTYDPARRGVWIIAESGQIVLKAATLPYATIRAVSLVGVAIAPDGNSDGGDVLPNGNLILADYQGDGGTTINDYLFEVDPDTSTLVNYWPVDGSFNTSTDGTNIDLVIDVKMGPNGHAYVTTAGNNNIYEIELQPGLPGTWRTVAVHTPSSTTNVISLQRANCPYDGWWLADYLSTTVHFVDNEFRSLFSFNSTHNASTFNSGITVMSGTDPMQVWVIDYITGFVGIFDTGQYSISPGKGCLNVLYWSDFTLGKSDYMAQALSALSPTHAVTTAVSNADFEQKIVSGGWDLVIAAFQNFGPAGYSLTNFSDYLSNGGSTIYCDWTKNNTYGAMFDVTYSGNQNQSSMNVTNALLKPGITNPFDLVNPGWISTFSMGMSTTTPGQVAATFPNGDAAIIIGSSGKTIANGFLTDTTGPEGVQLFKNEILALTVKKVSLLTPNGGERLPSGSTYSIRWNAPANAAKFNLKYTLNNGVTWTKIAKGITTNSYSWTVPTVAADKKKAKIKITAIDKNGVAVGSDVSDLNFTVLKP